MKERRIQVGIYDVEDTGKTCKIINSHGFSLEVLQEIENNLNEDPYLKHPEYGLMDLTDEKWRYIDMILEPQWIKAQRSPHPPCQIEIPAYWDFTIIQIIEPQSLQSPSRGGKTMSVLANAIINDSPVICSNEKTSFILRKIS